LGVDFIASFARAKSQFWEWLWRWRIGRVAWVNDKVALNHLINNAWVCKGFSSDARVWLKSEKAMISWLE
jgi:hypothetical protein